MCCRLSVLLLLCAPLGCTVLRGAPQEPTSSDAVPRPKVVAVRPPGERIAGTETSATGGHVTATASGHGQTDRDGGPHDAAEFASSREVSQLSGNNADGPLREFAEAMERPEPAGQWRPTRLRDRRVVGAAAFEVAPDGDRPAAPAGERPRSPPRGGSLPRPQGKAEPLELQDVLVSVQRSFPLLDAARALRDIAEGQHLAAHGAFDLKVKAASENGPIGFYETYRHRVGLEQPTYWGGSLFAGYRIGRGSFQPWYLERLTDEGGEFKGGVIVPLLRNVGIDTRRAELWKTNLGRQIAASEFRLQQIGFVRDASYAYWDWVAAGHRVRILQALLDLALERNAGIRRKVETGAVDPPVLVDNQRLIASREAKLLAERRKLQETAVKLSLYYRDAEGRPQIPDPGQVPEFPAISDSITRLQEQHVQIALRNRPELQILDTVREQLQIDRQQARNETRPDLSLSLTTAKDVGPHASSKRDKRPFELEAGVFFEVPVQRRKALGKLAATEAKLRQVAAKRSMTGDKIAADVQAIHARLRAALGRIDRVQEARQLAERLAEVERRRFELGNSDLLAVNLREQQAAQAQLAEIQVLYEYFTALADLNAALAVDALPRTP